ncbi:hypothetical protein O181_132907 [Austropuccinia psidii MF-1]|uniref:Copia protein n=1 Tax=Austropuccinia psidii MF-1 TaxID=1389203 RepID=A0A9Q3L7X4_9BASI|nr:hypothetical protein [Austropuccinia psidii MF-1]
MFDQAIPVNEDNQACINTPCGNRNVNTKRMRHVDIQLHFVKEAIIASKIMLQYLPTSDMLADFLTKSVGGSTLTHVLTASGVLRLEERGGVENHDPPPETTYVH